MDERSRELEFRDGKRIVRDYLADMMSGIETHRLTYAQAVEAANKKVESDYLDAQRDKVIAAHFREPR